MNIGIGLPANIPGVSRDSVLEWAQKADSGRFSSVGIIDRVVYPNWDPLIALAAAAAVTAMVAATISLASPLSASVAARWALTAPATAPTNAGYATTLHVQKPMAGRASNSGLRYLRRTR